MKNLIAQLETYVTDYVSLIDPAYSLPIALWILGTHCYMEFDAYPYLVITAAVKRCGKTRLSEMISFTSHNPQNLAAMTPATFFRIINKKRVTIINDEAEDKSSEAAGTMRSVLNVGYRKGQQVPRATADGEVEYFDTYCPKVFVLIGDVYDTLRDRSIVVTMRRGEPRKRFTMTQAMTEGQILREACASAVTSKLSAITEAFQNHQGLPFLQDRDEEIWTALFCLCAVFAPDRVGELERTAVDMSTEKTAPGRRYIKLAKEEARTADDEHAKRLLLDLYSLFVTGGFKAISTVDALEQLKEIPTGPWRRFKGEGLTMHAMSQMLSRFGVRPVVLQLGKGKTARITKRGYKAVHVSEATGKL